jgi:hypothetical protein
VKRAWCLIRENPVYRREAFVSGLRAVGFDVVLQYPDPEKIEPEDALLIWNRYGANHELASKFDRRGGNVFVAENAYVGIDREDRQRYAIAVGGHNGSGAWPYGGPDRWESLGITLKPWRTEGDHVLICPNRSFGMPRFIMPPEWAEDVAYRVARITSRPVKIRPHPGNGPPKKPLLDDLQGAWAVVIWSSSAGCQALIEGIPVFCEAPWWIAKGAACKSSIKSVDNPDLPDRLPAFERLAWAQWSVREIERGEPFQHLLDRPSAFGGGL